VPDLRSADGQATRRGVENRAGRIRTMMYGNDIAPIATMEPFETWPLTRFTRDRWIGDLSKAAKADHKFPRDGDPNIDRKHLSGNQAESAMLEVVDDADNIWLCL
jgi:hypothetical protein